MEEAKMAADVLQLSQIETLNVPCQELTINLRIYFIL